MYDAPSAYRSAQVTTATPAGQVVLLYEGALRFTAQFTGRLDAGDLEGAHAACVRAQAIVSALRESLDLSAGPIAHDLDGIYDFMHRRLVAANVAKQSQPAVEVAELLRSLLEAWRTVAAQAASPLPAGVPQPAPSGVPAPSGLAAPSGAPPVLRFPGLVLGIRA
jgi:flagellar protein FliS